MPEKREFDFFIDAPVCSSTGGAQYGTSVCANNETAKKEYYSTKNEMDTSVEKYENMDGLFGRELVGTINMGLGISLLILYVYYNK